MVDHVEIPETMHIEPAPVQPAPAVPIARENEEGVDLPERVREPSARELAMEAIFKNRERAIAKELHYGEDLADRAREDAGETRLTHERLDVDEQPAPAAPAASNRAAEPAPPAPAPEPAQPETHVVTVQGQTYRVTTEQLQQLASIGAVALDASNREQAQARQQPQQQHPQPQAPAQQPQQRRAVLTPEESQAIARRLQYGSDAESNSAVQDMSQLIAARLQAANPQIDPRRLAEYATQQAMQRMQQQAELNNNLAAIGQEFPEVFADESLSQLAALKLHAIRKRDALLGVQQNDLTAYREACAEVRGAVFKQAPAQSQPTLDPTPSQASPTSAAAQASRFEAKRAAPRSPQPAQRTLVTEEQGRRYPTASEIVSQMKKSRGQVV